MYKIAKSTILLMMATMIAKILGFVRELVLASSYGASMYSDAYLTAMNVPLVIFAIIGTTLGTVLIPMYFEVENELGEDGSIHFINNVFNLVVVTCIILALIGITFTKPLVKMFAIGFKGEILYMTINFTRIIIIGIVFTGLSYTMTAYLQIKNNFVIPGLITVPRNIIIIISIIFSVKYNPYIMIFGTLIAMGVEFLFQLPFAIKAGYRYKSYININDKYIKKSINLIIPVLIGVAVTQVNMMVDRTLASTLSEGSISALNYANKLNGFVMALFIASIATVIYPIFSKLSAEEDKGLFIKSIVKSINSVIVLVMPISVGAIVLSKPIVRLLFERGAFDSRATEMTVIALIMYSIGTVAYGLRSILDKVFYSLKDTKTPMINGVIAMSMNIVLNILLVKYLKLAGLALATSLSSIICILLLFRSLKAKLGYFGGDKVIKNTLQSFGASVVMGIATYNIYNLLNNQVFKNDIVSLAISILFGAILYLILALVLKIEFITLALYNIKNKMKINIKQNI